VKKTMFLALLALAACGKKHEGDKAAPAGSAAPATAGSGSGSAAPAPTPAGSGSAVDTGSGSAAPAASSDGSAAQVAPTPTPAQGAVAATPATPDMPAATDFEADAQKQITEKNLEAEVAKMEKDLGTK
jgi:hypothetical protein